MNYYKASDEMNELENKAKEIHSLYEQYINSPFLRKSISKISLEKRYEQTLLDFQRMSSSGLVYDLYFFYDLSIAFAEYCEYAYFNVAVGSGKTTITDSDLEKMGLKENEKQLSKILIDSFPINLKLLAKKVQEMLNIAIDIDTKVNNKPLHVKMKDDITKANKKLDKVINAQ